MLRRITVKDMIGNLEGLLGDDDYSEPLEILINSANNHNKFNLYGAFAFKNQLKDRLKMRSRLNDFIDYFYFRGKGFNFSYDRTLRILYWFNRFNRSVFGFSWR